MRPRLDKAFSVISALLVVDLVVQLLLAGAAVFTFMRGFEDNSPASAYKDLPITPTSTGWLTSAMQGSPYYCFSSC
jgi:hypothetical protein